MLLGQRHGRVKADDRKHPRHLQDGLDHRFAYLGKEIVELSGVVPGHAGTVVAVIDVPHLPRIKVATLEHHGGIALTIVMILKVNAHTGDVGQVRAVEGVHGEGAVGQLHEPVGVLDDPFAVDPDVIGHHVAGQADAALPGAVAQVAVGVISA